MGTTVGGVFVRRRYQIWEVSLHGTRVRLCAQETLFSGMCKRVRAVMNNAVTTRLSPTIVQEIAKTLQQIIQPRTHFFL